MRNYLPRFVFVLAIVVVFSLSAFAQTTTSGSLTGTVVDPHSAVVPGASVVVKNEATGVESTVTTSDNGAFTVPALSTGLYTVTITHSGFKQSVVTGVKIDVGQPSSIAVSLEVGAPTEVVTVVGGGELLQTQSANVANTITGRQITDLPYASRNALDVVLFLPGTATVGRPRQSTVNGLPQGSLNITLDGVNVQDNLLKNSDGFFTYIQPKTDAIQEVTSSTATPGAESNAEGAVQIKFTTRQGGTEFHGSGYLYERNSFFNANYWFNNRDLKPDPVDGRAPRNRVILTQPGFRLGGPILIPGLLKNKNRAQFFVNYEEYRLPETASRQRTILTPAATNGSFSWTRTSTTANALCVQTTSTVQTCTQNLLTLAAANGQPGTRDPTVGSLLDAIQATTGKGSVTPLSDPNLQQFTFINSGFQKRQFPTVNLTVNLTKNNQLTNVYNYQIFRTVVDFLNSADPRFPGFPNHGSQASNRFSNSTALVSKLTNSITNEARFALVGGTVVFFPEISPAQFANQGGFSLGINAASGITTATASRGPQRRNSPVKTFTDNLSWGKGNHSITIGGDASKYYLFSQFLPGNLLRAVTFGIDTATLGGDPANVMFNATNAPINFPGASSTQLGNARGNYATLIGRVTALDGSAVSDESGNYTLDGNVTERAHMKEGGLFVSDSWRFRPNITLTAGLRYELQMPFTVDNKAFLTVLNFNNIFGCSGPNNFFNATLTSTCTNPVTQTQRLAPGSKVNNTDWNNFAPTVGFAYSPDFKSGFMHKILGNSGQSVIRGGFSVAYNRDGTLVGDELDINPGQQFGVGVATTNDTAGNGSACAACLPVGTMLRAGIPTPVINAAGPTFPFTPGATDQVLAITPNFRTGYVMSWSGGFQREILKDTVIEARYVGNRAHKLTRLFSLNEANVTSNGFLSEFLLAQANLIANNNSGIAARKGSFAYFGAGTGTNPLPIFLAYLQGLAPTPANASIAANYSATSLWTNTAFTNVMVPVNSNPSSAAGSIFATASLRANGITAGLPANFFVVNPGMPSGAFIYENSAASYYDALQIELRRRLSKGLLVQGSYTFSKAITDFQAVGSQAVQQNFVSLKNPRLNRAESPFNIRNSLKADFIYELPIGQGKWLLNGVGHKMNMLVGGWGINGTVRVQSGTAFNLGNVQLVNMTRQQLQSMVKIRKGNPVFFLPQTVIDNTIKAFNFTATNATGPGTGFTTAPDPTAQFIAPAGDGCVPQYGGACGFSNVILYGPRFTRFDLSLAKQIKFSESKNLEMRVEALDAFNNINFRIGAASANQTSLAGTLGGATFGQTSTAYQDLSTTNDPGGRLIQFVLRFNF